MIIASKGYQLNLTKLLKLFLITVLGAGLLQASILYNQAATLGLSAGPNSIVENFSTPSLTQFAGLTLQSNTSLYYDPNGAAGCGVAKGETNASTLPNLAACAGDSTLAGANSNEATIQPSLSSLLVTPDINVDFNNPVSAASLFFAAPNAGPGSTTFEVQLYKTDQTTPVDVPNLFMATLNTSAYLVTTEGQPFSFIDLTELTYSAPGVTPVMSQGARGYLFNGLIGQVQASALSPVPEPGTIGLLILGLAGIGYFVRRHKA
jgi:hypothetical protein